MKPSKLPLSNRTLLILCGAALLLALISLGTMLDFSWSSLFPTAEDLDRVRREEKKMKSQLRVLETRYAELQKAEAGYHRLITECWDENTLGSPDILLPKKLTDLAKELNIETINTSPVKRSKQNNDLMVLELDIQMTAPLVTLTEYWTKLAALKPAVRWKRIELRPQDLQATDALIFRGTLSLFGKEGTTAEKSAAADAASPKGGVR